MAVDCTVNSITRQEACRVLWLTHRGTSLESSRRVARLFVMLALFVVCDARLLVVCDACLLVVCDARLACDARLVCRLCCFGLLECPSRLRPPPSPHTAECDTYPLLNVTSPTANPSVAVNLRSSASAGDGSIAMYRKAQSLMLPFVDTDFSNEPLTKL